MGLMTKLVLTTFMVISSNYPAEASWQGPANVINLGWGNQPGQVAITYGDTEDDFPHAFRVDQNGNILVADSGNTRLQLFSPAGGLTKIITPVGFPSGIVGWPLQWELLGGSKVFAKRGDKYQIYDFQGNLINQFNGVATYIDEIDVLPDDSIVVYKSDEKKFYQYSPTGQLIKTTTARPAELGLVKEERIGGDRYKITVSYPDRTYPLILKGPYEKYVRDSSGYIYAVSGKLVKRFNYCGRELGALSLPENQVTIIPPIGQGFEEQAQLIAQYGEPVVAPNGDVYTWKRTPDNYSILKWTWVDDPNAPTGPDAPSGLTVTPSINGLYLTWTASPQDLSAVSSAQAGPGCVTGYEIARATSAGGVYSTVATVDKGVIKYNDTTASASTTYYYKVRAMAGTEFSPYTAEVSGKR